jgi:3-phosphoshikimate 1-carboxyvinyltransferase
LHIRGPIRSGTVTLDGTDSQPVSAMLIASTLLEGETEINVTNPGERPWVDLTLDWLSRSGVDYSRQGYHQFKIKGGHTYRPFDYVVPNDFGSLGFLIAGAIITQSEVRVEGFDLKGYQADRQILDIFQAMGAKLDINVRKGTVTTTSHVHLKGIAVDVNDVIDALPILAVVGCFAESTTHLYNATIARKKESDRIFSITKGLKDLGANIEEKEDGLLIYPSKLIGNSVFSYEDHRIAMSLAIAGLGAKGQTLVKDTFCIAKSYPNFVKDLISLGANIRKVT